MEYFIITNRLTNLRRQIEEFKVEFEINKQNKNSVDYITYLQMSSSIIDTQISREIDFIKKYDNCFSEIDKGIHKRRCKQLNQILFDFEKELISFGSVRNVLWEEENGFDFEINSETPASKNYLENHLEIVKEFREFIKIDKINTNLNTKNIIQSEKKIELTLNDFIFNVHDKKVFAEDLKKTFNVEKGIEFKIMIELLKQEKIFSIGDRKFKAFYEACKKHFDRDIGSRTGLNDLYKHSEENKVRYSIDIEFINEKLKSLISKHKKETL